MWFLPPEIGFCDVSISSAYKTVGLLPPRAAGGHHVSLIVADSRSCFSVSQCSLVSVTFLRLRTALHSASVTQFAHDICCSLAACCCCRPLVIQNELYIKKAQKKQTKNAKGPSRMLCSLRDSGLTCLNEWITWFEWDVPWNAPVVKLINSFVTD